MRELIGGKQFTLKVDPAAPVKNPADYKIVGKPMARLDIPGKLTGQFTYMQDFRVPGMLHGRTVRPPAIGAKLESVDESSIKDIPGFVKVVRDGDFLGVVAESEWSAVRAAREIKTTWSKSETLARREKALGACSRDQDRQGRCHQQYRRYRRRRWRPRQEAQSATYDFAIHTHGSIGPSCAITEFRDGKLISWSASQATHNLRKQLGPDVFNAARRRALHLCRRLRLLWPQRSRRCRRRFRDAGKGRRQAGARAMVARRRARLGSQGAADLDRPARQSRRIRQCHGVGVRVLHSAGRRGHGRPRRRDVSGQAGGSHAVAWRHHRRFRNRL